MDLRIKVIDGEVIEHPVTVVNLNYCFGMEIPPEYVPFYKEGMPSIGVYEVCVQPSTYTYDPETNTVTESWTVRDMTAEEKKAKQDNIKTIFFDKDHPTHTWTSWTFDEETCTMKAPEPAPEPAKEESAQGIGFNWVEGRGWIRHKMNHETNVFEPVE